MSVVDEIKQRLDIVDVVSDYVTLQKAGRNFKALCPFHAEKTASFFVFPERQSWHCFGSCGIGGDIFSFMMKKEGISFGEALKLLADRAGVTLVTRQKERADDREAERLYQVNEAAARYYHYLLLKAKLAEMARRYLDERGISKETIDSFELGFSPDSWDALRQHLISRGYRGDELVSAGLVVEKEGGVAYDLFRNRLVIPIRNEKGRVAGFGARALDSSTPKYLNSPLTAVFDKSGILYGIDRARGAIKEQGLAIIVEGYMDVIIAHQYGMANVVASMGTSLTDKQMGIIKRLTKNLILALDADAAGDEATLRGLEVARQAFSEHIPSGERDLMGGTSRLQVGLKIVHLPTGKDPDEVIRENPANWQRLVNEAKPLMNYFFDAVTSKLDSGREADKAIAADQLLPLITQMADKVERQLYLRSLAEKLGVDERVLEERAAQLQPTMRERSTRKVSLPSDQTIRYPLEEYYLSLVLQHPELRDRGEGLSPDYLEGTENREIFIAWQDSADEESLRQSLDISLWEHLDSLMGRALPPAKNWELETAFSDCTRRLGEQRLRRLKALEETLISEAESQGDKEEVQALLQKALEPNTELRNLLLGGKRARKGA
jgi:DNA primase